MIAILILQILIIIFAPVLLIKYKDTKIVGLFGTIGFAYLTGFFCALIIFIIKKCGLNISFNSDVSEIGSHIAIGLAIPLLLFSTNLKSIKALSSRVIISFLLLILSVIVASIIICFILKPVLPQSAELSGMAIGLYTGGTPNLNAIGSILRVNSETIAIANLSDMIIGGIFYIFLLVGAKPLLKKFLNAKPVKYYQNETYEIKNCDEIEINNIEKKKLAFSLLIAFLIAMIGALIGFIVWKILGGKITDYLVPSLMITATVLGLIGSCSKKLRETKGNNLLGHYLILVFSVALSMAIDFDKITSDIIYIFILYLSITLGTFVIHILLNKIFKIDVNCAIITLTAGIYGPAFIPSVTKQLGDDKLLAVGLICGSLGYAIGSFLGTGIGLLLILLV